MRWIAFCLTLSMLGCGVYAHAEEPPTPAAPADAPAPAPAPKPDPKLPDYSIEYLMPSDDNAPEGWKVIDADGIMGAPTEGEFVAMAEALQLDDEVFYVETAGLKKDGTKIGVAMIDVDKKVYPFLDALKGKASAAGWRVVEIGSPARLLVVGGKDGTAAEGEKVMTEFVVYRLARIAMNRMNGRGAMEAQAQAAALAYRDAINAMQDGAGVGHMIEGRIAFVRARIDQYKGKRDAKVDKVENDKAAASFQKSVAEGVVYPPKEGLLVWVTGQLGGMLLVKKDKSLVPAATRALELAVENEKHAREQQQRFSNRYNLACAYALGGKTDKALDAVRDALETMKSLKANVARKSWEDMAKDKDFDSIRNDPRFSKLYSDYEPKKPKNWDKMKAEQEKRRREREKKKKEGGQ